MRKFQGLLSVMKQSYIGYHIIHMNVSLKNKYSKIFKLKHLKNK